MDIFDRFSTHLKEVLAKAMQIANELKHEVIEPLHLFYALVHEKGSLASELIRRFKPDIKIIEQMILTLPSSSEQKKEKIDLSLAVELQIPPLSSLTKIVLEKAMIVAQTNKHKHLGTEHLLIGLLENEDKKLQECFKLLNLNTVKIKKEIEIMLKNISQFPEINEITEITEQIQETMANQSNFSPTPTVLKNKKNENESALNFFTVELTNKDYCSKIDPVIGREAEIERLIQILLRRNKNNPILLGEPGVGKTAIVEGLAKMITEGKTPPILRNKKIFSVDMGLLIAGAIYRGEFESRLKELILEVTNNPDYILFIDEIHNIVGAGSNQGSMDAANLLKPALARGEINCIGSTTPAEYKKFIESDSALERRLMPIIIKEPTAKETIKILQGLKSKYEKFHQVKISPQAISLAVELSDRYINGKFFPDKAIDILDETAASKKINIKIDPLQLELEQLYKKEKKLITQKETAAIDDQYEKAILLKEQIIKIKKEINKLEEKLKNKKQEKLALVSSKDIFKQISKIMGQQIENNDSLNSDKYNKIISKLRKIVVGQDEVINDTVALIRQSELGLSDKQKPIASLMYAGPSGSGKTTLAKALSDVLYPNQDALIKINMSEFSEKFSATKLLGSPAGYVGYKEVNQFTDKLKLNPYSVVLFDEIDKAHPDIVKLLLQILDEGEIEDASGKKISFKHAIIILTTSYAYQDVSKSSFGFNTQDSSNIIQYKILQEKLKEKFSTELIDRLNKISFFNPLNQKELTKIALMEISKLNSRLKKYLTSVKINSMQIQKLLSELDEKEFNARNIKQKINIEVENTIAQLLIKGDKKKVYQLQTDNKKFVIK